MGYNRYAYCYNNPIIYTDPDGEFIFVAFLIGMAISATIDYGIQVGMNYANGYRGKDAWVNKVDFFDVAVSGAIGGLTAGWGASLKAGESVGKVGMFMVKNTKLVTAGEIIATSAIDITGEGWQDVSFSQFGQRAVTGVATMYASDFISKQFKKSPTQSIEQRVDDAIKDAKTSTQFTKSSLKRGQQMHKGYKASLHNPTKGLYKEFTGVKGIRPDFVDMNKRIIYELKPNNLRQISAGWKQLNIYKALFEKQYGGTWETVLDLY